MGKKEEKKKEEIPKKDEFVQEEDENQKEVVSKAEKDKSSTTHVGPLQHSEEMVQKEKTAPKKLNSKEECSPEVKTDFKGEKVKAKPHKNEEPQIKIESRIQKEEPKTDQKKQLEQRQDKDINH